MLKVKIINKSKFPLPEYKTGGSAGMDLMANIDEDMIISPMDRVLIPTGLYMELPNGYEAQIRARSGLSMKYGITLINGIGTIDSDYRGEIKIPIINLSKEDFVIKKGDRLAQMVIIQYTKVHLLSTDNLNESHRDVNGFGSTGI